MTTVSVEIDVLRFLFAVEGFDYMAGMKNWAKNKILMWRIFWDTRCGWLS